MVFFGSGLLFSGLHGIAAAFQLADHSLILLAGVLRGLDAVKGPAVVMFSAHWLIGVPLGTFLAFGMNQGAEGICWDLSAGLLATNLSLGWRAWRTIGRSRHDD